MNLLLFKRRKTSEDFTSEELNAVPRARREQITSVEWAIMKMHLM